VSYNRIERYKFAIEQHAPAFYEIRLGADLGALSAIGGTNPWKNTKPTTGRTGQGKKIRRQVNASEVGYLIRGSPIAAADGSQRRATYYMITYLLLYGWRKPPY
jgi:hypothetical protein